MVSSEEESVRSSLLFIMETEPSEQPHDVRNGVPLGAGLRSSLFESAESLEAAAPARLQETIAAWEPRVVNVSVVATPNADRPREVVLTVTARLRSSGLALRPVSRPFSF